jgi:hypothetical protein
MRLKLIVVFALLCNMLNAQVLDSSNLPIIIINTAGNFIPDEPKVVVGLNIKYKPNGGINYVTDSSNYSGNIGIEQRGSSSFNFGKNSYGFETLDANLLEVDTPLLNLPAGSDWILNASHSDKTFLRNCLPHYLYQQLGNYSPRCRHVEVILNGQYQGVYILQEKIKRGNNRIDIAKLGANDTSSTGVTGGYILKSDKPTGNNGNGYIPSNYLINNGSGGYNYSFDYPSTNNIHPTQQQYIKRYIDSAENALHGPQFMDPLVGYRNYFNTTTFMDYIIVNEWGKNPDTYVLSTYFYKPKDNEGRKLCMGPVWDFDLAFKNSFYFDAHVPTGFIYPDGNRISLFKIMMSDSTFVQELGCRWHQHRAKLFADSTILKWVDSNANNLQQAQQRNFALYPILGVDVYYNLAPYPLTYNDEIDTLKAWLVRRAAYLDAQWPAGPNCLPLQIQNTNKPIINIVPNPTWQSISITSSSEILSLQIINSSGLILYNSNSKGINNTKLDVSQFSPGIYIVIANTSSGIVRQLLSKY